MAEQKVETKSLKEVYLGYAKESKDNLAKGGKNIVIDQSEKYDVEFIKDFKNSKKGDQMKGISKVMYDYYSENKAVKKLS